MNRTLVLPLRKILIAVLTLLLVPVSLFAQDAANSSSDKKPAEAATSDSHPDHPGFVTRTYYLDNTVDREGANEILIALRNILQPQVKIYLVYSENVIELSATPEEQALAQKIIAGLDRRRPSYRLTFTLTDSDAGKRLGVQHFSVAVLSGQHTTLKEGNKVPVLTGSYEPSNATQQTQFTYLDIGMNFDMTLDASGDGLRLRSKVEQSSLADEHMTGPVAQDPIVRQTVLEGTTELTPGKPVTLGSIDIPGSTRHIDIEVIAEPLP